jgi:hypothetical protein
VKASQAANQEIENGEQAQQQTTYFPNADRVSVQIQTRALRELAFKLSYLLCTAVSLLHEQVTAALHQPHMPVNRISMPSARTCT